MARKVHKYHFIYKIVNIKSGKYYIGMHSTHNPDDGYMGGGKRITNSIRKHGKEAHTKEILEYFDDRESLRQREIELVNEDLLKDPMCMNLQPGGGGGISGPEHMQKFSKAGNDAYREKLKNPEYKQNLALKCDWSGKGEHMLSVLNERGFDFGTLRGKSHSSETISKMKESKIGQGMGDKNSQFGRKWVRNLITKECIKIDSSEYEHYINLGWESGRFPSESYSKLTELQVIEIKKMLSKNVKTKEIANLFDVSITAIAKIKRGETYNHINIKN
jgi:hypothetical protein